MAESIYITSAEGHSGKSSVALGVLDTLIHEVPRVGVFRPIARSITERDYVLDLLLAHDGVDLEYDECVGVTYDDVHNDPDAALSVIVERFKEVESKCDAVVIVGSDYTDVGSPTELSYNARIAANLGAPVLLVLTGRSMDESRGRTADEMRQIAELSIPELAAAHATLLAVVVNRADENAQTEIKTDVPVWAIPESPLLVAPTVGAIQHAIAGELLQGDEALLNREAMAVVIAAMTTPRASRLSRASSPRSNVPSIASRMPPTVGATSSGLSGIAHTGTSVLIAVSAPSSARFTTTASRLAWASASSGMLSSAICRISSGVRPRDSSMLRPVSTSSTGAPRLAAMRAL